VTHPVHTHTRARARTYIYVGFLFRAYSRKKASRKKRSLFIHFKKVFPKQFFGTMRIKLDITRNNMKFI